MQNRFPWRRLCGLLVGGSQAVRPVFGHCCDPNFIFHCCTHFIEFWVGCIGSFWTLKADALSNEWTIIVCALAQSCFCSKNSKNCNWKRYNDCVFGPFKDAFVYQSTISTCDIAGSRPILWDVMLILKTSGTHGIIWSSDFIHAHPFTPPECLQIKMHACCFRLHGCWMDHPQADLSVWRAHQGDWQVEENKRGQLTAWNHNAFPVTRWTFPVTRWTLDLLNRGCEVNTL